jgi:hypothetical protein
LGLVTGGRFFRSSGNNVLSGAVPKSRTQFIWILVLEMVDLFLLLGLDLCAVHVFLSSEKWVTDICIIMSDQHKKLGDRSRCLLTLFNSKTVYLWVFLYGSLARYSVLQ